VFAKAAKRPRGQSAIAERIAVAVAKAEHHNFREELTSLAEALARRVTEDDAARKLRVWVFVASFGVDGFDNRLEALGVQFGVTGSRICQLLAPMREQLKQVTVWSPAAESFLERLAKSEGEPFESRLERELEWLSGADIENFWLFTRDVLKLPAGVKDAIQIGQTVDRFLRGGTEGLQDLSRALQRPVASTLDRCGVAHVHHVIGRALVEGHLDRVPASGAMEVLRQMPGVVFLGKARSWFTRLPIEDGVLLRRVRKVLHTATEGLHLLEIYESIGGDAKWGDEHNEEHPLPPPSILGEWLEKVEWIEITPRGRVRLRSNAPIVHFSALESAVLESLEKRGGVALVSEVTEDCARTGLAPASVRVTLVTFLCVRQVVLGIYALRGREIARARYLETMAAMGRISAERARQALAARGKETRGGD